MSDWNPQLYRRLEDERTRTAAELLARLSLEAPRRIVDLGRGPGNATELLVRRFQAAHVPGIDTSECMLASARVRLANAAFAWGDIAPGLPHRSPRRPNGSMQTPPCNGSAITHPSLRCCSRRSLPAAR